MVIALVMSHEVLCCVVLQNDLAEGHPGGYQRDTLRDGPLANYDRLQCCGELIYNDYFAMIILLSLHYNTREEFIIIIIIIIILYFL
jgi:hypothetical protein